MKKITILTFVIILMLGCSSESELNPILSKDFSAASTSVNEQSLEFEEDIEMQPPRTLSEKQQPDKPEMEKGSKIIKEGSMLIEVKNLTTSKNYIDSIVENSNGYYEKEVFRNSDYEQRYSLKIRIPSSKFIDLVQQLEEGKGAILEKNINAKDVTEEYLDLEIRLENNRAYLKRYTELLGKAQCIKDMLEIQERIRKIELLVDSNLGRIKYLSDRVNFSTLSIELFKKPEAIVAKTGPSFMEDVFSGLKNGFSGVLYFLVVLANLWPIILGLLIIWIMRRKIFGRFLKKATDVG